MTRPQVILDTDPCNRICARPQCGAKFTVPVPSHRKRFCSRSCAVKTRPPRNAAANANWRGGKTSHPLYDIYMDMIGRCHRPTHQRYADYGGRGITVSPRWRADFWAFVADMGDRPEGMTLDRADNDRGYGPDNCRWASLLEQRHNRRPQRPRPRCPNNHEYTPENTRIDSKGWRHCILCAEETRKRGNASVRRRRAEAREAKAA